ncbi:MAG TPA: hypothetical protein VFO25_10805 [Candidatus Eremiobacteraceae bacterium]|nr:hypothetical protein [Candidatus Eremiobacteraceae bacterium]
MKDAELDRILSQSEPIVPSDSFVASVMSAVAREGAPSPLAFPWLRALPGFIGLAASLGSILVFAVRAALATGASTPPFVATLFAATPSYTAGWMLIALGVTLFCVLAPLRFARYSGPTLL